MRLIAMGCGLCLLVGACSLPTRGRGQACQRTAQCGLGLACIAGKCSTDLRSVAARSTVPDLAGAAGSPASDAGTPTDGG